MDKDCKCNKCVDCGTKKCGTPCGCAEPVFSIEAQSDDPTVLRFNVNGKSVWYDFDSLVKDGQTCTALSVDAVNRTLNYNGECGENVISASELGGMLHLADIGDVNANSIDDYGILNYRKNADCGEGCEGINNGWTATNPIEVGRSALDYILGTDANGAMMSLMPPTDASSFSYLAWGAQGKAGWRKISQVAAAPQDSDGKVYRLYLDPNSGEIVAVKGNA